MEFQGGTHGTHKKNHFADSSLRHIEHGDGDKAWSRFDHVTKNGGAGATLVEITEEVASDGALGAPSD